MNDRYRAPGVYVGTVGRGPPSSMEQFKFDVEWVPDRGVFINIDPEQFTTGSSDQKLMDFLIDDPRVLELLGYPIKRIVSGSPEDLTALVRGTMYDVLSGLIHTRFLSLTDNGWLFRPPYVRASTIIRRALRRAGIQVNMEMTIGQALDALAEADYSKAADIPDDDALVSVRDLLKDEDPQKSYMHFNRRTLPTLER